jgi:hypothetical protein
MGSFVLDPKDPERDTVRANLHRFIDQLPQSKAWKIEWKQYRKERTDPQNAALFGLAYPILSEETGYTVDELHEMFCRKFFGTVHREVMGETIARPSRTTTTNEEGRRDVLPWDRFAEFFALVQREAAFVGTFIPDPDPAWRDQAQMQERKKLRRAA